MKWEHVYHHAYGYGTLFGWLYPPGADGGDYEKSYAVHTDEEDGSEGGVFAAIAFGDN